METPRIGIPITKIDLPSTVSEMEETLDVLKRTHGENLIIRMYSFHLVVFTEGEICACSACTDRINELIDSMYPMTGMIVCSLCGNKRCPHATSHEYECTKSNMHGQTPVVSKDFEW